MGEPASGYTDFEVVVGHKRDDGYPIDIIRSPYGEHQATMPPPFPEDAVDNELTRIKQVMGIPGYAIGPAQVERAQHAVRFGRILFDALMRDGIDDAYRISKSLAEARGQFLRVKLRVRPRELAALPWELLYDPGPEGFILLHDQLSLVRYVEKPGVVERLEVEGPLHVLGVMVDLPTEPSIGARAEQQHMVTAMAALEARHEVHIEWLLNPSWRDLLRAMDSGSWHVFHFIGHAGLDDDTGSGYVVMASDGPADGEPIPVRMPAADLAAAIGDTGDVRLAVINACRSGETVETEGSRSTAETLVEAGIPAAIGMQHLIDDDAAIEFSRQLFGQLARRRPLDRAVAAARKAIDLAVPLTLQWAIPTLHLRSPNGVIFERSPGLAPRNTVAESLVEGMESFHERNWVRAVEVLDQALGLEPDNVELLAWRAVVEAERSGLVQSEMMPTIVTKLNALLPTRADDMQLVALRGLCLAALKRWTESLRDLDLAADALPDLAGIRVARARCHLALERPLAAIADLDSVVDMLPGKAHPLVLRAEAWAQNDDYDRAIEDISAALITRPGGDLRRIRAGYHKSARQFGKAADDLAFYLEVSSTASLYVEIGDLRMEQAYYAPGRRDYGAAIAMYSEALQLAPGDPTILAARGQARLGQAETDNDLALAAKAVEDYRRAIQSRPDDSELHYRLGRAFEQARRRKQANATFLEAARLGSEAGRRRLPFWQRWRLRSR